MKDDLISPINILEEKVKSFKNDINWLIDKNLGHQTMIDGNNEQINDLTYVINELNNAINILNKNK